MPISTLTSDGLSIACILLEQEWGGSRLSITHRFPSSVTSGISGRESRRAEDEAMRLTANINLVLEAADAAALRQQLATLGKTFVGVPLWNDQLLGSEWSTRVYDPERIINLTTGEIFAKGSIYIMPAAHTFAPLLVGHIDKLPSISAMDEKQCQLSFSVTGDAPWAFRIGINATGTPGTWPSQLLPNWTSHPTETPEHGLSFAQIGEQRERVIEGEERAFRWTQEAEFWFGERTELVSLLSFFVASQGMRRPFSQPWWFRPGTGTAEAPLTTTVRFTSDTLRLDFFSGSEATAKIGVTQLPWEIAGVDGEVPLQPSRAFLYKITYSLPTPIVYRFTNWPVPLVRAGDGTYVPQPFKHREISGALDLSGNQVSIDSFIFSGNPLTLFHPDIREGRLLLTIFESETEPISADTATVKWFGEIRSVKEDGRKLSAAGAFIGRILERQLPNVSISNFCQTTLFSPRCGLVKSAFLKTGTFTSAAGCVLDLATSATDAANTFVHGSIEVGSGAAWEVRSIIASEPITGGQRVTVDWPVRQAASGQAVAFFRGCDLQKGTCQALGNFARFRGHPNRPITNLSLPAKETPGSPGKK